MGKKPFNATPAARLTMQGFAGGALKASPALPVAKLEMQSLSVACPPPYTSSLFPLPLYLLPLFLHHLGGDVVEGSFFRVIVGADVDDAARICGIGIRVVLIAALSEGCGG